MRFTSSTYFNGVDSYPCVRDYELERVALFLTTDSAEHVALEMEFDPETRDMMLRGLKWKDVRVSESERPQT